MYQNATVERFIYKSPYILLLNSTGHIMETKQTPLHILHKRFLSLSPKERNEAIQALFTAIVMEKAENGEVDQQSIDILKALSNLFNISLKYDILDSSDREITF